MTSAQIATMTQGEAMALVVVLVVPICIMVGLAIWFLREQYKELRGYDNFARHLGQMRREARERGADFKTEATVAKHMLGLEDK